MAPDVTGAAREAYDLLAPGDAPLELPGIPAADVPAPAAVVEATVPERASAPLVGTWIPTVAPAQLAAAAGVEWVECAEHGWELGGQRADGVVCGQCAREARIRAEQGAPAPDLDTTQRIALPRRADRVPTPPHLAAGGAL